MNLEGSLIFLVRDGSVFLGRKMRGVGEGFWNGFGGKMEKGETIEAAAVRELKEEIGIDVMPGDLMNAGIVDFHNTKTDAETVSFQAHIYILEKWQGEPRESDEMKTLTWFSMNDLPRRELRTADREWMPVIFQGHIIHGDITYAPDKVALVGDAKIDIVGRWKNSKF